VQLRILEAKPRSPSGRSLRQVAAGWLQQDADTLKPEEVRLCLLASGGGIPKHLPAATAGAGLPLPARRAQWAQWATSPPPQIEFTCVSEKQPTAEELADLKFAWLCVKHVKSNAITGAREQTTATIPCAAALGGRPAAGPDICSGAMPPALSLVAVAKDQKLLGMGSGQPNRVKSVEIALEKAADEVKVRWAAEQDHVATAARRHRGDAHTCFSGLALLRWLVGPIFLPTWLGASAGLRAGKRRVLPFQLE
jgi:phosphoribosylaminoimidazolecarboxamide formyltransferase/IMP cyclohydrolase